MEILMPDSDLEKNSKTPIHLWIVGIVGLLWNAMGAMDYFMTQTKNEEYMSAFTAEQLAFFYGLPTWTIATWAIAVWGGVLGTILLLMRNKIAVPVFLASFIAMAITSFQNFVLSNGLEVMGDTFSLVFSGVIFVAAIGFYIYSRDMLQQKILR
jgi:hypothetical protein